MTLITWNASASRLVTYWSIACLGAILATGCATPPVPINYAPSSVLTAAGAVKVGDFKYLPAESRSDPALQTTSKKTSKTQNKTRTIAANQIRNTAIGSVIIDRDVRTLVRDAVFSELRFVGVKTESDKLTLKGDIEEFLIDDLGYSVDWTLRVRFELVDTASQQIIYQSVKNTQRKTAKFVNVFGALNETIKLNFEELIKDSDFLQKIKQ